LFCLVGRYRSAAGITSISSVKRNSNRAKSQKNRQYQGDTAGIQRCFFFGHFRRFRLAHLTHSPSGVTLILAQKIEPALAVKATALTSDLFTGHYAKLTKNAL
jgi:hypothetical protein